MINIQRISEAGNITEVITLDATLEVGLSHSVTMTEFPVEDGATISDHAQKQPDVVTVRGLVSATPLRFFSFSPIIGASRTRTAFDILTELQEKRELVRVVTDLRTYDNMMLLNLTTPRRPDTKNALFFTALFKEVKIVSSQIVQLPPEVDVQETATVKEEGGKVTPAPTESADQVEEASLLFRALNGLGVIQ